MKGATDILIRIDAADGPFRKVLHFRLNTKGQIMRDDGLKVTKVQHNGHKYPFMPEYASRLQGFYSSMPADYKWIKREGPRLDWMYEILRPKRILILRFQEPCNNKCSTCNIQKAGKSCPDPDTIMPIHMNRIIWPTGELRD